jgi:cell division protein FtsL
METRVAAYRLRALFAEQRANELSNPTLRQEWEELAIEFGLHHLYVRV